MEEWKNMQGVDPKLLSPGALAFLGDAVYELFVREQLVRRANMPVNKLHLLAVEQVRASFQSKAAAALEPLLTEEELAVWKRGRNANGVKPPKHADPVEYRRATGLEALFGYLFLQGNIQRLNELFCSIGQQAASGFPNAGEADADTNTNTGTDTDANVDTKDPACEKGYRPIMVSGGGVLYSPSGLVIDILD